jgi:hypothetical protein
MELSAKTPAMSTGIPGATLARSEEHVQSARAFECYHYHQSARVQPGESRHCYSAYSSSAFDIGAFLETG